MNALGRWAGRQFTTRTIVLIPIAIAINISLGYTTQSVLKLPIYLDSIGTILTGVLCGPLPGALTGLLSNLIWQYSPGIGASNIGPFAGTAALVGLLAGFWGYLGIFKSRRGSPWRLAIPTGIAVAVIALVTWRIYTDTAYADMYPAWVYGAIIVIGTLAALGVAAFVFVRRDAAGAWVAVAGALTGVAAALASAPVAAYVYGGVTGSGTDLIVAALRQGGSDIYNAALGQSLISDPIDKTITSFVVLIILSQFSGRFLARFPLGNRLVSGGIDSDKQAQEAAEQASQES